MNRQEYAELCFDAIMQLHGEDEFKEMAKRLHQYQLNRKKFSLYSATLPNYLWVTKRGGGVATRVRLLAEYLDTARIMEFTGKVRHFEFQLAYVPPDKFFSELPRLDNTLSEITGHQRFFRGLACINITEWMHHTREEYFRKFIEYISSIGERVLTVFYVNTENDRIVKDIEYALSHYIRFESVWLQFPRARELMGYVETKYFKLRGFELGRAAKSLLEESLERLMQSDNFNGYISVNQFADDVIHSLLTSEITSRKITADMIRGFDKESDYAKRLETTAGVKNTIGFGSPKEV